MNRRTALAFLTLSSLTQVQAAAVSQPVKLRFGNLLWVYGQYGLPRIQGGKLVVPLSELCAMLSARCDIGRNSAVIEGERMPVLQQYGPQGQGAYTRLTDLTGPLNLKTTWDTRSQMVNVTHTVKKSSILSHMQGEAYGFSAATTVPLRPVQVKTEQKGANVRLQLSGPAVTPGAKLTLFMGQGDGNFATLSPHGLGSPDLPKGNDLCSGKVGKCEVTQLKPTYALAILERP